MTAAPRAALTARPAAAAHLREALQQLTFAREYCPTLAPYVPDLTRAIHRGDIQWRGPHLGGVATLTLGLDALAVIDVDAELRVVE
jgi:hypothetical protein